MSVQRNTFGIFALLFFVDLKVMEYFFWNAEYLNTY